MSFKKFMKKVWYFLWEEESILSWIANVLLAFIIIKFMLYPGLGYVLGTPAPIVAVVSGSMEHDGNFNQYWSEPMCCSAACSKELVQGEYYEEKGITRAMFRDFDFVNGFNKGDIMVLYSPKKAELGDVIVYLAPHRPDPIIHRVIQIKQPPDNMKLFYTKGDHNCDMGSFEEHIPEDVVVGKAVWRVPFLGWVKIAAVWVWQAATGGV